MNQAKYGVILYGGASNETGSAHLVHHAILALVRDLNDVTRFVCLPMGGGGNLTGAENAITSQTGYPPPVNLARAYPRYGPGEYSASISLERGEPDAALIVAGDPTAGLSPAARHHLARIPSIVLDPNDTPHSPGHDRGVPHRDLRNQHSRYGLSHGRGADSAQASNRVAVAERCGDPARDRGPLASHHSN